MRIGIECTTLTRPRAGIGFYNYHLVRELAALDGEDEYYLFYNRPLPEMNLPPRLRHVLSGPGRTHLWGQTRLASLCAHYGIDVLHSPGQCLPLMYNGHCVLTVHDLSAMLFPRQKDARSRFVWNCLVPAMARKANRIIAVSENTRRDAIDRLGIAEDRVTRIYEAAAPEYYPEPDAERLEEFRRRKGLQPGYILAVGTLEPRKNYSFLLRLFARWLEKSHPDATLVIVGKKGWLYDEIFKTFESLSIQRHVRFEGYVPDLDLMRLYYSAAQFSILNPIYEGFWLPGLESLACGTPVIAPKHSSIPEVVGEAGILIETGDEEEWLAAMDRLWMASDRQEWAQRGIRQAKRFSWRRAAKRTLNVYRSLYKAGKY
ncbi:MAG: glycosyltransferase family 1 protein [Candidatus Omnitrophota bacterium]